MKALNLPRVILDLCNQEADSTSTINPRPLLYLASTLFNSQTQQNNTTYTHGPCDLRHETAK